jgi:endonuclease-3
MAPPALKSARSTANSRVSLISQATPSSDFTSLRRSTRSTTRVKSEEAEAAPGLSTLNLSSYAYNSPPRKRIKTEVKEEEDPLVKIEPDEKPRLPRAASTARAKAEKKGQGQPTAARIKAHPEPPKWREQYALIEKMRAGIEAPVDTMWVNLAYQTNPCRGCERPLTMHGLDDKVSLPPRLQLTFRPSDSTFSYHSCFLPRQRMP